MTLTFSIILATYNRAHFLERAIRSVLGQTFQDFELIVVDDASTDGTTEIVNSYSDARIIYLRNTVNSGPSKTRNTGIREATGQYIAFLDDDDEYLPNFLFETYRTFEQASDDVGFGWSGIRFVLDTYAGEQFLSDRIWVPQYKNREHAYLSFLEIRRVGSGCGFVVRRTCFDEIGLFDEAIPSAEDAELLLRLVRKFDFAVTAKVLVKGHRHSGVKENRPSPRRAAAYEYIISKNMDALSRHPRLLASLQSTAAAIHYKSGNKERARELLRMAAFKYPFHKQIWLSLAYFEVLKTESLGLRRRLILAKDYVLSLFRRNSHYRT